MLRIGQTFSMFETAGERKARETKEAIAHVMRVVTHDMTVHAEVIAQGPLRWRNTFLSEMRGMAVDSRVADLVYVGLCKAWKAEYGETSAKEALATVEVRTPLTEKEIENAWEHDASSSSWDARRRFYMDYPSKLPIEISSTPTGVKES